MVYTNEPPAGLFYLPAFLSNQEERELLDHIGSQPFVPYNFHGYLAKREIVFYGSQAGYKGTDDELSGPVPSWLYGLRGRCAGLIGLSEEELAVALIARYPSGAGIGWHRDAPQFGPSVIGVSFASAAQMRFRIFLEHEEQIFRINLQPGSAYIMSGAARSEWQHGMNPVHELRYSITFRTIKDKSSNRSDFDPRHMPENIAARIAPLNLGSRSGAGIRNAAISTGNDDGEAVQQLKLFD